MIFEKSTISGPSNDLPMSCDCGTVFDPEKSRGRWTVDQKHNAGTCNTIKA